MSYNTDCSGIDCNLIRLFIGNIVPLLIVMIIFKRQFKMSVPLSDCFKRIVHFRKGRISLCDEQQKYGPSILKNYDNIEAVKQITHPQNKLDEIAS